MSGRLRQGRRLRLLIAGLVVLALLTGGAYFAANAVLGSDRVRLTLEQKLAEHFGQPVRVGSAGAGLFPPSLELRDVSIGPPGVVQLGEIRLKTGLRGLLSRRIEEAEVAVSKSRISLPLPFPINVPAPSAVTPKTEAASSGVEVASVRAIALRDVELVSAQGNVTVDLDASIDGDRLQIEQLTARAKKTRLVASGTVRSLTRLDGTLDAHASPLELDEIIAIGSALAGAFAPPAASSREPTTTPAPLHIRMTLSAPEGHFASQAFRDLSTTLDLTQRRVSLSPLSLRVFGGAVQGKVDADIGRSVPQLRLSGRLEGFDISEVMKATGSPGSVTGRLTGTSSLVADGTDAEALIRSARGTIGAAITDGTLPGLDMVRTIVLAFGKPSGAPAQGLGSAFSRLVGTFTLADGILATDNLRLASRDFDMQGSGTLRLGSGEVNSTATVVLSEELTAQAGTDLRRYAQDNGRVTVPVTIRGPIAKPTVFPDIAAATRRALGNELKRRATSMLGGLFKKKK
jgi:hypothetical protein